MHEQDFSEMQSALVTHKRGPARKMYKAESDAHKAEMLSKDIVRKSDALFKAKTPVNFHSLDDVQRRTRSYLEECANTSTFPSMMGLASFGFGVSRQAMYSFLRAHPDTDSARFIDRVRDTIADILSSAALMRNADAVTTIFVLKNGLGFADRVEIEPIKPAEPDADFSMSDLAARYGVDGVNVETDFVEN